MGMAKTGLPGVSILAILAMAEAFPGDAKSSVGAIMPAILVGDVIAVFWFRRHAQWQRVWSLIPFVAAGMACGTILLHEIAGKRLGPILGWLVVSFSSSRFAGSTFTGSRYQTTGSSPPLSGWWRGSAR